MKLFRLLVSFAGALASVFASGYVSQIFVDARSDWWKNLIKPSFMPPEKAFQIAWLCCYIIFIAVITVNIYRKEIRKGLFLCLPLLGLNIVWTVIFFTLRLTLLGLGILTVELAALAVLTNYYIKNTKELWLLMVLLLSWYAYALILNYGIVMLN